MISRASLSLLASLAAFPVASDITLDQPVDCELGKTCFIQHLVDLDPGPTISDFRCGSLSYDGHKGTDFALPTLRSMKQGVDVIAAADGVVAGWRDGMADRYYVNGDPAMKGVECGNGVLVRHSNGWETQYCHLRQGSVTARNGDVVKRGDVLGQVGLSGKTQFPHLHLSVRKDGRVVDPFSSRFSTCGDPAITLWRDTLTAAPGGILDIGFTDQIPRYQSVKNGDAAKTKMSTESAAVVLFAQAFAGRKDDVLTLVITGPKGEVHRHSVVLKKSQDQLYQAAGKRLGGPKWPSGSYTGTATLERDGKVLGTRTTVMELE